MRLSAPPRRIFQSRLDDSWCRSLRYRPFAASQCPLLLQFSTLPVSILICIGGFKRLRALSKCDELVDGAETLEVAIGKQAVDHLTWAELWVAGVVEGDYGVWQEK